MKRLLKKAMLLSLTLAILLFSFAACSDKKEVKDPAFTVESVEDLYLDNGYSIIEKYQDAEAASLATQLGLIGLASAMVVQKEYLTPDEEIKTLVSKIYTVEITVKDFGTMTLDLYEALAPKSVDAFVSYAKDGFYDGLKFHRIIDGFMIQGGDPTGTGYGDSSLESIPGEFAANGWFRNQNLTFKEGVIGMARTNAYDTASSQFFICLDDYDYGNGQYASFGKLTAGNDVLKAIGKVEVGGAQNSTPVTDVIMESVKVVSEREEVLATELTDNITETSLDFAFVFFFDNEEDAIHNLAKATELYGEYNNNVNASSTKVNVVGNTIVVSTENPLSVMQGALSTEN